MKDDWRNLENLVLVPGHAIYIGKSKSTLTDDNYWILQDFQKGEPKFYIEHIRSGVKYTDKDKKALLIFTGGQTREKCKQISEAKSYLNIAQLLQLNNYDKILSRITTEEFAKDSFENVLFGICRFFECTDMFPKKVTIVNWKFKEKRFKLHWEYIKNNASILKNVHFEYIGVNNPVKVDKILPSENKTIEMFQQSPRGIHGELAKKKQFRNPFNRYPSYKSSCPRLSHMITIKQKFALKKNINNITLRKLSIACCGNWIIDSIHSIRKLPSQSKLESIGHKTISHGGGASNVAMALRKLSKQIPILAIGCVGNDKKGKKIKQECRLNNLDIKNLLTLPNLKTSYTLVFVDNKKTRTMFHHQGANKKFNIGQVFISELINKNVKYFYLGHMLLLPGLEEKDKIYSIKAARLLKNIKEHHIDTILDMTTIDRDDIKKIINPCLKYTDHLVINEIEATALTGIEIRSKNNTINKNNIFRSAKYLLNAGVKSTVVIHMKEGALCLQAKNHNCIWHDAFDIPKSSIKSVCGAGDAFCAGFIMGLYHKYSLEKTLQLAIAVSNLAIQSEHNTNGILSLNKTMLFANKFCKTKKHFTKLDENFFDKITYSK